MSQLNKLLVMQANWMKKKKKKKRASPLTPVSGICVDLVSNTVQSKSANKA